MNIGVDAGALSVSDERLKVGVYRVIVNLLVGLGRSDRKNNFRLYSFDPIDPALMETFGDRMENRVVWPTKGWSTVSLPLELSLHPVDLFLGTSQMIPRQAGTSIGFLYDVGFAHRPESYPGSIGKLTKQTKDLIAKSRKIITISDTVKADICNRYGYPKDDIVVAYPGVGDGFTPKGPTYKHARPYFLFVGAMKPGKNVPSVVRAFSRFLKTAKNPYDLLLVGGDYWKDGEIEATITSEHLNGKVYLQGHVSDDMLPSYYRGAVAFVSPSFYEGFCLPAVEAMACGCPVIGSTSGAMREIIGDAGILVDPSDAKSLVGALEKMAYNVLLRKKYAKAGIERAKQFTWKSFAGTAYSVIDGVLRSQ